MPAITIKTTEPVLILNSTVRGRGDLIKTAVDGANVTIRNMRGYGLNPNVFGQAPGRFLKAERFKNVVVENSYMEGTSGIYVYDYRGNFSAGETVRVLRNKALNIDGRLSDGRGGFLDFNERTRISDGFTERGFKRVQFLQLNQVRNLPGIEIAWNQVVNEPGKSRVEDNVSIYRSSGTQASPIAIHDNYIQGAYTIKPWQSDYSDGVWKYKWSYAGGGIMLGDGEGAAFVKAFNNQVVSTTNYGIAIYSGHDMEFFNNRVLSSGLLPDGRTIARQNVGVYIWDGKDSGPDSFYNNSARQPGRVGQGRRAQRLVDPRRHQLHEQLPLGRPDHPGDRAGRTGGVVYEAVRHGRDRGTHLTGVPITTGGYATISIATTVSIARAALRMTRPWRHGWPITVGNRMSSLRFVRLIRPCRH